MSDKTGNDDTRALHLWRARADDSGTLSHTRIQPNEIERERPSLIILPGLSTNHSCADNGRDELDKHIAFYLEKLGGTELAERIQTLAITYPDYRTDR